MIKNKLLKIIILILFIIICLSIIIVVIDKGDYTLEEYIIKEVNKYNYVRIDSESMEESEKGNIIKYATLISSKDKSLFMGEYTNEEDKLKIYQVYNKGASFWTLYKYSLLEDTWVRAYTKETVTNIDMWEVANSLGDRFVLSSEDGKWSEDLIDCYVYTNTSNKSEYVTTTNIYVNKETKLIIGIIIQELIYTSTGEEHIHSEEDNHNDGDDNLIELDSIIKVIRYEITFSNKPDYIFSEPKDFIEWKDYEERRDSNELD